MLIETTVSIKVNINVSDEDPRSCGKCPFIRAGRCALYRLERPDGVRRVAPCVRDTQYSSAPNEPAFYHVRDARHFNLLQLQDIVNEPTLDSATRSRLAEKWKTVDKIKQRSSYCVADTDVYGYGPTDNQGFFAY